MDKAYNTLALPYTYNLITVPPEKRAARRQLGTMSADIIKSMRDEVALAAVATFLSSRGLTSTQIEAILGGTDGAGTTGVDDVEHRTEERTSEAAATNEATGRPDASGGQHTPNVIGLAQSIASGS